jgi:hypothetical protein
MGAMNGIHNGIDEPFWILQGCILREFGNRGPENGASSQHKLDEAVAVYMRVPEQVMRRDGY